jgi:hypothetical protein
VSCHCDVKDGTCRPRPRASGRIEPRRVGALGALK